MASPKIAKLSIIIGIVLAIGVVLFFVSPYFRAWIRHPTVMYKCKFEMNMPDEFCLMATTIADLSKGSGDKPSGATRLNDEAIDLMHMEKFDSALQKLDQAIGEDPNHVAANYHRGICLAEKHRFDEAIAAFDKTTTIDPKQADAYFNKGKIHWYEKRYSKAVSSFEKAIEHSDSLNPANRGSVWLLLGESLYEIHLGMLANKPREASDSSKAIGALEKYLELRPSAPDRKEVEQKIDILKNPSKYLKVIKEHRKK